MCVKQCAFGDLRRVWYSSLGPRDLLNKRFSCVLEVKFSLFPPRDEQSKGRDAGARGSPVATGGHGPANALDFVHHPGTDQRYRRNGGDGMFRAVRQGILGPLDQDGSRSVGRGLPLDRKCAGSERFPVRAPVRPVLVQLHPADQGHPGDGRRHLPVPSGPVGDQQDHGRRGAAGAPSADHLRQLDPVAGRVRGRGRHDGMLRLGLSAAADYLASREQRYLANRSVQNQGFLPFVRSGTST